ncbi:unnamed protein product [Eruca vesicaria subsp. sativa]|uniref:Uncharacterized protein n=1 Tax=Eruca vesicaria subsp. sativa TaxID=29727 RepID=A0ABC8K620_ERUVS|nr:unnamed protein product [Eruca vesicaria subsp. sativa]
MEFSLIADTVSVCTVKQGIAFGFLNPANHISFNVDQSHSGTIQASANKTIRRIRKKRRMKHVSFGEDGGDFGCFLLEGGGNDGLFGGGGGGKGWNYGCGGGGGNWDESLYWSWSDPAMEFVYEVICWIALSNCVHFAFKRIVRILKREKLNLTLSPVC